MEKEFRHQGTMKAVAKSNIKKAPDGEKVSFDKERESAKVQDPFMG